MKIGNSEPMVARFWMVYGERQGAPTYKHDTREAAEQEAARLAKLHPGIAFYALKAVSRAIANKPEVTMAKLIRRQPETDADPGWQPPF